MKTPIFEFKINEEKKMQVAKYFFPNKNKFDEKELKIIKRVLVQTLISTMHVRIKYPKRED